jgi:hypothetical protein
MSKTKRTPLEKVKEHRQSSGSKAYEKKMSAAMQKNGENIWQQHKNY